MSTAAYDYEDLHHLVDRLSPGQVQRLRLLVSQDEELSLPADPAPSGAAGLLQLIGAVDGPPDLAEHHDSYVRDRFSAAE
ncbi:MAG TPA: hypothetical protein VLM05_21945 [Mycobacteriales bacterium]|nr:hypothetical protein [Mycobacteriales bacterium]